MASYKDVEIDECLTDLIGHMHSVNSYREALGRLQSSWDTLTLLGELSGTAAEMTGTRGAFEKLSGQLLNHLALETRKKTLAELRAKAQSSIDILVRNLFERTADIGFLASDTDVREFLAGDSIERAALESRFAEYVAKYSVYRDIVLFDPQGRIRARLARSEAELSQHPLLHESLTTQSAYVEFFGGADFLPDGDHLIYAYRVTSLEGRALGVLALVFRLDDEMEGIYQRLIPARDWTLLACATPDGRVIASSCSIQLPLGHRLPSTAMKAQGEIQRLGGRQYITIACKPSSYQGYPGPGWVGLGLIPTDVAFQDRSDGTLDHDRRNLIEAVTQNSSLFSDELRSIPRQAAQIQSDLNRSVWNGSVHLSDDRSGNVAFSKTLLREISHAGRRTQAIFDQSIGNLQQTVVAAIGEKVASHAAFAIDVMDRNLYERANDCRWWALDATLRRVLESPTPDGLARCGEILSVINGLYTVYTNLLLFDAHGQVLAVSDPEQAGLVGSLLEAPWVQQTLELGTTQAYAVSDFVTSRLYGDRATYVYCAAVRSFTEEKPVGGVAIVFDAAPQFSAMLIDALPRDDRGKILPNSFSLFVDRDGRVIAASDEAHPVGTACGLDLDFSGFERGSAVSRVLRIGRDLYAVGVALSGGYREYKTTDGYRADIFAVCAVRLGEETASLSRESVVTGTLRGHRAAGDAIELATFMIGGFWFGLPTGDVVEAIDASDITAATGGAGGVLIGYRLHRGVPIPVLDVSQTVGGPDAVLESHYIIIVRANGQLIGLLVDSLSEITEISAASIVDVDSFDWTGGLPAKGVVRPEAGERAGSTLLIILHLDKLTALLGVQSGGSLVAAE